MRAPRHWQTDGWLPRVLSPLSAVWTWATRRRLAGREPVQAGVPVICVGNLTAGGTGKTPVAIWLLQTLSARGIAAHALSRGHGGSQTGPLLVDPGRHKADQVGDEPLLLAAFAPAWIARDRVAGARAAVTGGAQAIIMGDRFQNPGLQKDLSLVVIDAEAGFGNGRVIPAGPLREPVTDGLARADLIVLIGPEAARAAFRQTHALAVPVVEGELQPLAMGMDWQGARVLAFAGIGRPEKFFATLRDQGANIVAAHGFGDHAPYRADLLRRLKAEASAAGAQLVTTEKDAVRLPSSFRTEVLTLPVRLKLAEPAALETALEHALARHQA